MARSIAFSFPLANGLHARPASSLEEAVRPFSSGVVFVNRRTDRKADSRSVLALVATETRPGDPCELRIEGPDEADAQRVLEDFLARVYPGSDEPIARGQERTTGPVLPRSLRAAGLETFHPGQIACAGLGRGRLLVLPAVAVPAAAQNAPVGSREEESARIRRALGLVAGDLERELADSAGTAAAILKAHAALLRDPTLSAEIEERVRGGAPAPAAVAAAAGSLAGPLRASGSALLRERVADLEDVAGRILEKLGGKAAEAPRLDGPTIVAASSLAPSRLLALDRAHLKGLVLGTAGATSHTAILARSFGIPTLSGMAAAIPTLASGEEGVVDARLGILVVRPAEGVRRFYDRQARKLEAIRARTAALAAPVESGIRLEVGANVATSEEIEAAFAGGADGIGLFRTEMLFLGRAEAPDEEEQVRIYSAAVRAARGRPLIVRTLDVGGDKPAPFLKLPRESNPFLGVRGVRWYAGKAEIIKTQLRALARAAAEGPLKIMVPMVAEAGELQLCRRLLAEAQEELRVRGAVFAERIEVGAMLEVPSVAYAMEEIAAEADFFSLGTNDLAQYFFAADRENPAVADPKRCFHPAFLRLVAGLAESARRHGRWIGLCGEWGEDAAALPLFIGLGLNELSVAGPRVLAIKAAAAGLEPAACEAVLLSALRCGSAEEVLRILGTRKPAGDAPLIVPELIVLDSDSRTKEEAIREMADALELAGRTDKPEAIEAAVWDREAAYSTGFGGGFALPHGKTNEVSTASMVVLRLREGVAWQSLDGKPVDVATLLVIRADDPRSKHLAAMSRFSRLLMREEFQERLRNEPEPAALAAFILSSLRPEPAPSAA